MGTSSAVIGGEGKVAQSYNSILVQAGPGGFGGPLVITPTETKKTKLCILQVEQSLISWIELQS
ncbi:hypothetical protein GCM10020331_088500 [Ectobacillus funiculus]